MSIPNHGPWCQTRTYQMKCKHCSESIFFFGCSCGSACLFDALGPPWPQHECSSGVGGSGLTGWQAIDTLRSLGHAITDDILHKVGVKNPPGKPSPQPPPIRREDPAPQKIDKIFIVREIKKATQHTRKIEELGGMGKKLLGLSHKGRYGQVTLTDNSVNPIRSHTCLIPERLSRKLRINHPVGATIEGRIAGGHAIWMVTDTFPMHS